MKKSQRIGWVILFSCLWISMAGSVTDVGSLLDESLSPRKSIPARPFSFRFRAFNALKGATWTQLSRTDKGIRYRVKLPNNRLLHLLTRYPYASELAPDEQDFIAHLLKDRSPNKRYLTDDLRAEVIGRVGHTPVEVLPSLIEGYVEILSRRVFPREDVIAVFFIGAAAQASRFSKNPEQDSQILRERAIKFTALKLQITENEVVNSVNAFFQKGTVEDIHQLVEIGIASINAANSLLAERIKKILSKHKGPLWIEIGKFHLPALVAREFSIVLQESSEVLDAMTDPPLQQAALFHARGIWTSPKSSQPRQEVSQPRRVDYRTWDLDKIDFKKIRPLNASL